MEFLTAIVGAVAKDPILAVVRQGGYIFHCKRNLQTLQTKLDDLKGARDRLDVDIDTAKNKGEHIYPDVNNWIPRVDEIIDRAGNLLNEANQAKMKCMLGCPNLLTRHQLGRISTKLVEEMGPECNKKFESISYGGPIEVPFLTPAKDYEGFDSRTIAMNGIINTLKNPDINKIGLYGIGGLGKTTMAEQVFRQVKEDGLFDDFVIVRDVKEDPDIDGLQQKIAEQLGMDYSKDLKGLTRDGRASRIFERLEKKKAFLVLDDIWNFFNLKVVGIPDVSTCKILFTSRVVEVLSNEMGTQKDFQLANLEKEECWKLFESKVGDVVKDPDIRDIAKEVANRCGGLPIFVITVASSLKKGTLPEWKYALTLLKRFEKKGLAERAFSALEWSYDRLDDELKPLFLLCGVIASSNSISLDELFKVAMGLGLLKTVDTLEDARNSLLSSVIKLKGFSLLLDHDEDTSVRIHDLVQEVANDIASRGGQLLSIACRAEFKSWPKNPKCGKISINSECLVELSEVLDCKNLEMFCLDCEYRYQPLPNSLFANMEKLKVLCLTNVTINIISLKFLKNLQALSLKDCKVEGIALVGELSQLEILSLSSPWIKHLPEEVGKLRSLRLLDLNSCYSLTVIAPNVLSRLTRLESLRVRDCEMQWEAEDEGERSNASLSELKHLPLLTELEISVLNPYVLPLGVFSEKLQRFFVEIGCTAYNKEEGTNTLALHFTTGNKLDEGLKMLVKKSEHLTLTGGHEVNETAYQLIEGEAFQKVRYLLLNMIGSTNFINSKVLFSSLTTLVVLSCNGIKFLLTSSTARSLDRLTTLRIGYCTSIEEIVSVQEDNEEKNMDIIFPKLEHLNLYSLPRLVGFYGGIQNEFSSSDEVLNLGADNVVHGSLFHKKVIFPRLETLYLLELPKLKAIWQNQLAPDSFCRLKTFVVRDCSSLINLFVPCIWDSLDALETLEVSYCPSLEVVFKCGGQKFKETHEPDSVVHDSLFHKKVIFPRLETLELKSLPKLKAVWQNQLAPDSFCRLKKVVVRDCSSLINLSVPCIWDSLDALETLEVSNCPSLEVVFKCGGQKFKETHEPTSANELKTFRSYPNLQSFEVEKCDELKYIFQSEEGLEAVPKFEFPKVTTLSFNDLPRLKSLYPGNHVSHWPLLEEMETVACGEIVAGELSVCQETQEPDMHSIRVKQPLIISEKGSSVFPNLKGFAFGPHNIWSGSVPSQLCPKLESIVVLGTTISEHATLLQQFHNLRKIHVTDSSAEGSHPCREIFVNQGIDSGGKIRPVRILPQVKVLKMRYMSSLVQIGKEGSAVPVFPNLEKLSVKACPLFKSLDTPAISFQNLTALTVYGLPRLKYLVTHQIATSLMQLTRLKIRYCRRMKAIVATEGDNDVASHHEIAFCGLKHLELYGLPRLRGLCLGSCNLKFPALDNLKISQRLKLKLFSDHELPRCTIDFIRPDTDDEDSSADDVD